MSFGNPEMVKRRLALAFAAAVLVVIAGPARAAQVTFISAPAPWTSSTGAISSGTAVAAPNPYANRLMVVAVAVKWSSGPIGDSAFTSTPGSRYTVTGTYGAVNGGAKLIQAASSGGISTTPPPVTVWIGYLKDTALTAQGNSGVLSVTVSPKGSAAIAAVTMYAAFFYNAGGLNQLWPTADGSSASSTTTPLPVPAAIYGPASGTYVAVAASASTALPTMSGYTTAQSYPTNFGSILAYKTAAAASESPSASGTAPLALAAISLNPDTFEGLGDGTPGSVLPVVAIMDPANNTSVLAGGSGFRVVARVFSPKNAAGGTQLLTAPDGSVSFTVDDASPTAMTFEPKYGGTTNENGFWVYQLPPPPAIGTTGAQVSPGPHKLQVVATNASGTVKSAPVWITGVSGGGDGNLLRRDNSSQLCNDCHTHDTHWSASTGSTFGSWAVACRDCHTPHSTKNIYVVRPTVNPPAPTLPSALAGAATPAPNATANKPVVFYYKAGYTANGKVGATTGVCQACHTRTVDSVGNPLFRNSVVGIDTNHGKDSNNNLQACEACHSHETSWKPPDVTMTCHDCHGTTTPRADGLSNEKVPPVDTCGNSVPAPGNLNNRTGAHLKHLPSSQSGYGSTLFPGLSVCTECHTESPAGHPPPASEKCQTGSRAPMTFGALASTGGASPSFTASTQICASVYCHGNLGQWANGNPKSGVASPQNITWNASISCGGATACHRNSANASAAPPFPHPARKDTTGSTCTECHPTTSTPPSKTTTTHVNGTINQTTFLCTQCHGALSTNPGVQLSDSANLYKVAPGATATASSKDAAGNTATTAGAIGAHRAHVLKTNLRTAAIPCTECHALPPLQTDTGHATGTSSVVGQGSRATLSFGTLAKGTIDAWNAGSTTTPLYGSSKTATLDPSGVYSTVAGSCSKVYCHGWFKNVGTAGTPPWDGTYSPTTTACTSLPCTTSTLTCTSCHNNGAGSPQPGGTHSTNTSCSTCHAGYSWDGTNGVVSTATHINGKQEGGGGGPLCMQSGCHLGAVGSRRNVTADFSLTLADATPGSHHVGTGGTGSFMGTSSKLTEKDCQVCHAEYDQAAGTTGALHGNGLIDLRDADNATHFFEYDPQTFRGSPTTANSGNVTWKQEMSGRSQPDDSVGAPNVNCALPKAPPAGWTCSKGLDRFCLSCHDADGASASYALGDPLAAPRNPFYDNTSGAWVISNERDEQNRFNPTFGPPPGVVDIASRVADSWRTSTGATYTAVDRDFTGTVAFTPVPAPLASSATRSTAGLTRNDPPEGIFSRHAIRGLSQSVYTNTSNGLDGGGGIQCYPTGALNSCFSTTNGNQWKSNSVMACADCHTTDGANTVTGNAHGSKSEYLLKNGTGLAVAQSSISNINCALCHNATYYQGGKHTNNGSDFTPSYGNRGAARMGTKMNIYGFECGNCHGGGPPSRAGASLPTPASNGGVLTYGYGGFGTIHGTSQVIGSGTLGAGGYRDAYRFLNGNSMRYYLAGDWVSDTASVARACVTLQSADTAWGGCTVHGDATRAPTQNNKNPMNRALAY